MPDKKSPYEINAIFEQMTLDLIASLKRNFERHKLEEIKEGFRWEQWQSAKLRGITEYRMRNKKIIDATTDEAMKLVNEILLDSYDTGQKRYESIWKRFFNFILKPFRLYDEIINKRKNVTANVDLPKDFKRRKLGVPHSLLPQAPPEQRFFKMNEVKLEALQQTVKNDLRKAQHSVLRKMDDVYRQTIFKAEMHMTAGAKTLNQAIDMATKEFLSKGINTIEYADGRRVNIASYAEMALRTASQRATFLGEGKKRDEWGVYTVLMSAHANCSPMCLPYQGTVMIDDVYTSITAEKAQELAKETGYTLLSEAMENHAFHPNCRHTLATFFPGVSSSPEIPDEEEAKRNYEAEQKQRYMERQIRKYKRLEAGSLAENNKNKYSAKVREWQGKLRDHLKENPQLRRDYYREQTKGIPYDYSKYDQLSNIVTKDNIKIGEITHHLKEQAVAREVSSANIKDCLENPLKIDKIKLDDLGRPSKKYIGEYATVAINPDNGNIITTYKTSRKTVSKLRGDENSGKFE